VAIELLGRNGLAGLLLSLSICILEEAVTVPVMLKLVGAGGGVGVGAGGAGSGVGVPPLPPPHAVRAAQSNIESVVLFMPRVVSEPEEK